MYNSGATWFALRSHAALVPWYHLVCFKGHTPRHSFIVWLAILNKLSTKDRLVKWMPSADTQYVLCGGLELRDHLFFSFPYSTEEWRNLTFSWLFLSSDWHTFLNWGINHLNRPRCWMVHIKIIWELCIYNLWREKSEDSDRFLT